MRKSKRNTISKQIFTHFKDKHLKRFNINALLKAAVAGKVWG